MKHTVIVFFKGINPVYGSVKRFECPLGPDTNHDTNELMLYMDPHAPIRIDLKDIAYYQAILTGGD